VVWIDNLFPVLDVDQFVADDACNCSIDVGAVYSACSEDPGEPVAMVE